MTGPLSIEMATGTAVLWRCLHGGPLAAGSPDGGEGEALVPWGEFRERNLAFLRNLTLTYGACAVVAKSDGSIIGHLRFYPKVVREMNANGLGLCLQQGFPSGPADDLGGRTFPPLKEIDDKTLLVHCMMLAPVGPGGGEYRHQGIGTRMARALIEWAVWKGWSAIEAHAYENLPLIYATSGQAGPVFWEDLGFRLVGTEREPALEEENDFARALRTEAIEQGLDPARISNKYIMRRTLG
jgi:hypothetical protein